MEVRCDFCGREGVYLEDIVDEAYHDRITGRDTLRYGCRDIDACLNRIDENLRAWQEANKKLIGRSSTRNLTLET